MSKSPLKGKNIQRMCSPTVTKIGKAPSSSSSSKIITRSNAKRDRSPYEKHIDQPLPTADQEEYEPSPIDKLVNNNRRTRFLEVE
jgi:hypothetical protein